MPRVIAQIRVDISSRIAAGAPFFDEGPQPAYFGLVHLRLSLMRDSWGMLR
jgi:hypothetical protein